MNKVHKLAVISLGCSKNLADTESILSGIENLEISSLEEADFVLLNTCGFLKAARDEVYDYIKSLNNKKIILTGCMASLFSEDTFGNYPQVEAIISSANYNQISEIVGSIIQGNKIFAVSPEPTIFEEMGGKMLLTPQSIAYVKIAEGCNNACSYCLIPKLKGSFRSREMKEVVAECQQLIEVGVKEINLVAQDCGCYGIDLYGKNKLAELLKEISEIKGDFWIRVLYIYPERIDEKLLQEIASNSKICKYLDIPLQHGDQEVLKRMRRMHSVPAILKKLNKIRAIIPNIVLRTSLIVGFPGENQDSFNNLKKFVKDIDFDHLGVFTYSREKGTESYDFKGNINQKLKDQRKEEIMLLQQEISFQKNKESVGKKEKVIIESYDPSKKIYFARSQRFAPEIDGIIFIKSENDLELHEFYDAKIASSSHYDLYGEIA